MAEGVGAPDVTVVLGSAPPWADACRPGPTDPAPSADDPASTWTVRAVGARLSVADGCYFYIAADGRAIWSVWTDALTLDDIRGYLLGNVLGYALRRLGVLTLHASAVVLSGRAVAFVGESGAGKSTLAMAFASAGAQVLTDDVFAVRSLNGRVCAYPSHDHLRVTQDTASRFVGARAASLALVSPTWDKYTLPLAEFGFARAAEAVPVAMILLIGARDAASTHCELRRLAPVETFLALLPHTKAAQLADLRVQAHELTLLAQLLEQADAYTIARVAGIERLGTLVDEVRSLLHA